ncbi:hypothetical protein HOY80DRAFT_919615 [Tuber brumale]|nr:hypothetical protein HOY80DRAFT_919615 [Tuber brumale]
MAWLANMAWPFQRAEKRQLGLAHRDALLTASIALSGYNKYKEAEIMYRHGLHHRDTLVCIYNLAGVLHKQREYDIISYGEVEVMHRRALTGREKTLGLGHRLTPCSLNKLGPSLLRGDR